MSNPLEDFIISLGFDTSKVKGQVAELHKSLGKLAVNVDAKRVKQALATEKKVSDSKIKEAKRVSKVVKKEQTQTEKDSIARSKRIAKIDSETRRKATIRSARNTVAEYERGTVGPSNASQRLERMIKTNASLSQIKALTENYRGVNSDTRNRMKQEGLLKSFDSASASKGELDLLKVNNAIEVLRARMNKLGIETKDLDKNLVGAKDIAALKRVQEQTKQQIALHKEQATITRKTQKKELDHNSHIAAFQKNKQKQELAAQKAQAKKFTAKDRNQLFSEFASGGAFKRMTDQQQAALRTGLAKQQNMTQARSYLNSASQLDRYAPMKQSKVNVTAALESGSSNSLRQASKHLSQMNAEMAKLRRESIGTAAAMSSMHDSTRNMVREYASMYALFAGTGAINQIGQQFESLESAMLAATGNTKDANEQMKFMTDLSQRLGLNLTGIADQYIKFKFAAKGKLDDGQIQELFTNTSELGTVLGLSQEKMKLSFNAMQQMMSKTKISSEELNNYRLAA
jgi:hypothetical protein